ncbi:stage II sporulation protein M [Hymenobacter negativus]|uniref:Stage II sporulation protein M n=1 Tax=Hymenobacter negativus TaxID=2795026 RepID=A0ABS0Q810_9BACT|nr:MULTISPECIES: stage II sporulation protein M [Bacteria]MBH8558384.1 stage II sporulation protein M [Hymenobacter negativus]MBH8568874.1 stage II sporulation protein M [Hymenobacter negativus]MBR7208608.1 stage II sporulation protein M [Microvirga sp. STS02]
MREALFLRQNQARWQQYETTPATNPDELAARFVALTDDLAYAQTFYPESPTTAYLNTLTGKLHQAIYKNKAEARGRFGHFWARELPLVVSRHQGVLAWTLLFFVLCTALGALSAAYDDTFVRSILGDNYVNQTLENIHRGDPMAIYKSDEETSMFLFITFNNIKVALTAFAMGITAGLGTGAALFYNGLMLGSFQYFFYQQHVLAASVLTIWIHGTLEISAIVLAGGAGFVMAQGILFPGTHSRAESFRHAAREGGKLALGLVPIFMLAGFLESFVTRHTEMPVAASVAIIGSSAAFILWYFGWYPWRLRRQGAVLAAPAAAGR